MRQPPSGGCVLKLVNVTFEDVVFDPAAFGRLRVETLHCTSIKNPPIQPPSGGCVLKLFDFERLRFVTQDQPPSGGCVLKPVSLLGIGSSVPASRLRAAAC